MFYIPKINRVKISERTETINPNNDIRLVPYISKHFKFINNAMPEIMTFPTLVVLCLVISAWNLNVRINNSQRIMNNTELELDFWPDWIAAAIISYGCYNMSISNLAWIGLAPGILILICLLIYRASNSKLFKSNQVQKSLINFII